MTNLERENIFAVSVSLINRINSDMELYAQLEDNYLEILVDSDDSNRCYCYRVALATISDEIDKFVLKYENVSVTEALECNSFIWHMQWFIGRCIDNIISNGYQYVRRDSAKLRHMLHMYECIYDHIETMCKAYSVYC